MNKGWYKILRHLPVSTPITAFVLLLLIIFSSTKPVVDFDVRMVSSTQMHSFFQSGTIWQEWCFYIFKDGSMSKKYLSTMDVSDPNYIEINKKAASECF
jgi:hypothetical protein